MDYCRMGQPVGANASTTCAGLANLAPASNSKNAAIRPLMAYPVQIRPAEISPALVASNSTPIADSISFSFPELDRFIACSEVGDCSTKFGVPCWDLAPVSCLSSP